MENAIKVILVEDKEKYRQAIRENLLPHNILVVAEAENGQEFLELEELKNRAFDVVLLDLDMPIVRV